LKNRRWRSALFFAKTRREGTIMAVNKMGANEKRMPAVFVGHGSPMLALQHDSVTEGLAQMGERIVAEFGKPRAILAVSAHWFTRGTFVQTTATPRQIYDMYGFPEELYEVKYPVAGSPELGKRVQELLCDRVSANDDWGIDHGVWTPLVHMFPQADVPIVEFSVNKNLDAAASYELGRALAPLRDEGYLVLGSGNTVHNLGAVLWDSEQGTPQTDAFDDAVIKAVEARDDATALAYEKLPYARYAVPTPDHYLPLAYILGAAEGETPVVFNRVRTLGSIAMTGFAFGL
jgi:4,5-DOPA dioxygenase extradiol